MFPSAELAANAASGGTVDLRTAGTGNPGGANAVGVLGKKWGYAVMAADIAKGVVACRIGRRLAGDTGQHVAGVAAVVGHCYPVNRGFRGGKGVAAGIGQCLATMPHYLPVDLAVAFGARSRDDTAGRAETATVVASVTWVAAALAWWQLDLPNGWGGEPTPALPLAAAASSAVILHRFRVTRR